jgi:PAS domain S-box-containing protein
MLGSRVSQWKSEVGAFFCHAYDQAVTVLGPIYTVHRAHHAVRVHLWDLVPPVRAEDGSLRLAVFNKPREDLDDLLRAVLDASPDGVLGLRCIRCAASQIKNAIVVTANQRAADIIGCKVENLLDHAILDVIPKLRGSKTWARYLEVVETRVPQRFELSLKSRGQARWFDVKAVPLGDGFVLSFADITSLKSAYHEVEAKTSNSRRPTPCLLRKSLGARRLRMNCGVSLTSTS